MSDFHLGLKQFLLEQTTTSSVEPFLKDEELPVSFQGYQMSQPSSVTKTSGQPMSPQAINQHPNKEEETKTEPPKKNGEESTPMVTVFLMI